MVLPQSSYLQHKYFCKISHKISAALHYYLKLLTFITNHFNFEQQMSAALHCLKLLTYITNHFNFEQQMSAALH